MNLDNILAALIILLGLFSTKIWYSDHTDRVQLKKYGVDTISQPFTHYVERQESGKAVIYSAVVTFLTNAGVTARCGGSIPEGLINQFKSGTKEPSVRVRYVPFDTSICTIEDEDYGNGLFMLFLGLIAVLGGGLYLFNSVGLSNNYD